MWTKIKHGQIKISITDLPLIDTSFDGIMRFRGVFSGSSFPNVSNPRKGDLLIWEDSNEMYVKTYIYTGSVWYLMGGYPI